MPERAVLVRMRPGAYRAYSRRAPRTSYRIDVARVDGTWRGVCDCQGYRRWDHCNHADRAIEREDGMTTEQQSKVDTETSVALRKADADRAALVKFEPVLPNLMPSAPEVEGMIALANFWTQPEAKLLPPTVTPQQCVAIMLSGREAGVGPMTALRHYFVVNGKPEPDTQLMLAIAMRNDPSLKVAIRGDAKSCTVKLTRARGVDIEFTYSMEDADRSGQSKVKRYWNKDKRAYEDGRPGPWQLYTADMLRWAALKRALKIGAPDLTNTVHVTLPIAEAERLLGGERADDVLDAIAIAQNAEPADGSDGPPADPAPPLVTAAVEAAQEAAAAADQDDPIAARAHLRAMLSEANANADRAWFGAFLQKAAQDHPDARAESGKLAIEKLTAPQALALAADVRKALYGEGPPDGPGTAPPDAQGEADGAEPPPAGEPAATPVEGEVLAPGEGPAPDPDDQPFE